jgi:hypothetical protein
MGYSKHRTPLWSCNRLPTARKQSSSCAARVSSYGRRRAGLKMETKNSATRQSGKLLNEKKSNLRQGRFRRRGRPGTIAWHPYIGVIFHTVVEASGS